MTRILAYRFSAFGDVAMTVPVFREFLEQNPDVELVVVSRNNYAALFRKIPRLQFHGVDVDKYKSILSLKKLADDLLKLYDPNYVTDFHDVIRTKVLNKIFKLKGETVFKIDKGKKEKEMLTIIWNLDKKPLKQTVERYADVLRSVGFPLILSHQYRPSTENKKGIGFAPFAQHKGKMLPLELSFELVKRLAQKHHVCLFGGGSQEVQILESWSKQIENTESLAGKLTLDGELNKIATLEAMISMDSANMHLASVVGTRCISVWGSTHPYAGFLGYGQAISDVVQVKDLTCRPCSVFGDKPCYRGDYACLYEIDIQLIIDKL